MKQTQMKIRESYPAAILDVPGMGYFFRVALYGQTQKGIEKVAVWNTTLQEKPDMSSSDFEGTWNFAAKQLVNLFTRKGWNPIRFIEVPEPTIVPRPSMPWKPQIREGR